MPKLRPSPDGAPERLETGTQNHEGIMGAAAAVRFLASLAGDEGGIRERLGGRLRRWSRSDRGAFPAVVGAAERVSGVTVYGPGP